MDVVEDGKHIRLVGDPHLGRSFLNGTPLARRGDREAMVWADFLAALHGGKFDLHICLGDLFDKWVVSYDLILNVAAEYRKAAAAAPGCSFFILKGNHDWIRDLERRSAFDVFTALVADVPNVTIVTTMLHLAGTNLVLYPWHPLWRAEEKLAVSNAKILFGHFDTDFGDHNMIPTRLNFERIYTGHIHLPARFTRDGTEVVVVGSLQPYAHGEEADDSLYVTLRPDEVTGDLRNKCVRILGQYDGEIDCLQLTYKAEKVNDDEPELENVTLGDFDMDKLFAEAFAEAGVTSLRTAEVLEQFHSKRSANGTA
ncbi:metallophosphoesterase [Rhizobium arsenicireducens]